MASETIVVDTTVLSNFAYTDSLSELCSTFEDDLLVTNAVIKEVEKGLDDGYEFLQNAHNVMPLSSKSVSSRSTKFSKMISSTREQHNISDVETVVEMAMFTDSFGSDEPVNEHEFRELLSRCMDELDWGEATVLQVGFRRDLPVATDDGDARELATEFDISVTGSLGLLARCVKMERIDAKTANRWLSIWIEENGYYSPVTDIRELL